MVTSRVNKQAVIRVRMDEWAKFLSEVCDKSKVLLPTLAFQSFHRVKKITYWHDATPELGRALATSQIWVTSVQSLRVSFRINRGKIILYCKAMSS